MLTKVAQSIRSLSSLYRVWGVVTALVIPIVLTIIVHLWEQNQVSTLALGLILSLITILAGFYTYFTLGIPLAAEYHLNMEEETKKNHILSNDIRVTSLLREQILAWDALFSGFADRRIRGITELKEAVGIICDEIVENRNEYFAFGRKELWNFAFYLWDDNQQLLVPIWRNKHPKHPSTTIGRCWRDGQGHVGHAFRRTEALITPDALSNDVRNFILADDNEQMPYDDFAYRSYASQPVKWSSRERPFGVLVATSDRPGRFDQTNALVLLHASAVLASTIQLAYDVDLRGGGETPG
jgi:hypothetical protein